MELIAYMKESNIHCVIKPDAKAGFYLYVYQGNRCIRDYLQDTLDLAKTVAFRDYQVPQDAWRVNNAA